MAKKRTSEIGTKRFSQKLPEAVAGISEFMQLYADKFGPDSPGVGDAYLQLHSIRLLPDRKAYSELNDVEFSQHVISKGSANSFEDTLLGQYLLNDPSEKRDRLETVESVLTNSLDDWEDTDPEKVRSALLVLLDLAAWWEIVGNTTRSAGLTKRVVDLCRNYLEPTDASTVSALTDMAVHCLKRGKPDEAELLLKEALEICEANPAAKGLYGPRVLMNLAAVAASRGQMPVAACYLDRALQVAERVPVADKSQILEVLCDQAKVYSAMNQRERFDQVVARAMKTAEERWRNDPSLATECMMTLFGFVRHRADLMRRDASPKR